MDEQNLFDGYFSDSSTPEPNATEIPKAAENTNYQDYTSNVQYQAPVNNPYYVSAPQPNSSEATGLGIGALVMGILSLLMLCCFFPLSPIFSIVGIVLYVIDKKNSNSGVSRAGFICSLIGLIISVLLIIFMVVVFGMAFAMTSASPDLYYY